VKVKKQGQNGEENGDCGKEHPSRRGSQSRILLESAKVMQKVKSEDAVVAVQGCGHAHLEMQRVNRNHRGDSS